MTWIPIEHLLSLGRPSEHPVAIRAGVPIPFARFQADVAAAAALLDGCREAALACEDTYLFTVGLFALLHAGARVLLPPNAQPGTLADLGMPVVNDALIAAAPTRSYRFTELDAERGKVIFNTSGSTGAPKQIEKKLWMLQRESEVLHNVFGSRLGSGPVMATVSHQHLYGLSFRLLWPLAAGVPFDVATDGVWETLLPRLRGGSVLISSPAHLGRLAGLEPIAPSHAPALIFTGGAPLAADAAMASQTILGCLPTEMFGSTECGVMATRQQADGNDVWTLLPGTEIRVDAEDRVAVRTPYVDDWQQTEDVIERLPGGFRFLGRADRIVKIESKRVSLPAVESALESLPLVAEAAVVALPGLPTRLGGLLVLTEEGRTQLASLGPFQFNRLLRRLLSPRLEPTGLPRFWRFTDALPIRALGKRNDAVIAALFGDAGQ
jgi:acyl-coenzyme A synthetase/AMP-(fatty) acid ligase